MLDYKPNIVLSTQDYKVIDTVIVEIPNPGHPFGVRGVAELPLVPPMAAVANAIHNATGVRMTQMPMSPGRIMEALWDNEASKVTTEK